MSLWTGETAGGSNFDIFSGASHAFMSDIDLIAACLGLEWRQGQPSNAAHARKDINRKVIKKRFPRQNNTAVHQYDSIILKSSRRHNIDPALVKAVIIAESAMNPRAVSKKGAKGLMQLMPETAKSLGVKNRLHPAQNIEAGTKYLKYLMNEYDGNVKIALAAYNAGPGTVKRYKGIPPFKATRQYIKKVLAYYDQCAFESDT